MPYVNVHGVNLYYEEYGKGPAVILTPGGRVDRNGLRPMAALLSPKCRVILHDRRNCGRSDVVIGWGALGTAPVGRGDGWSPRADWRCPGVCRRRLSGFTHLVDAGRTTS